MPSDWLAGVWQTEEGPEFASAERVQEIMSLIMRMHNDIAGALRLGEEFGPPMLESTLDSGETVVVAQG
jgi:yecA family protein